MASVAAKCAGRDVRLSVVRSGFHGIRLTDHPNPTVHSGYSIDRAVACCLADALLKGSPCRVNTFEGRVLELQGIRLGDTAVPERAWTLDEHERPALGRAILAAAEELP
jgi:hypothetical protein